LRFIKYKGLLKNQSICVHYEISPGATGIGLGQVGYENDGVHAVRWKFDRGVFHNRAMKRRSAKYQVAREAAGLNSTCKHDQLHNHNYRFAKWRSKVENTLVVDPFFVSSHACAIVTSQPQRSAELRLKKKKKEKLWRNSVLPNYN